MLVTLQHQALQIKYEEALSSYFNHKVFQKKDEAGTELTAQINVLRGSNFGG
jgi:hypothetical protein